MEDFINCVYKAAIYDNEVYFGEYDESDLSGFLSDSRETKFSYFIELGKEIISLNGSGSEVKAICVRKGLKEKACNKFKSHWEVNKVKILGWMTKRVLDSENKYRSLNYSLKTQFYTKKEEFQTQGKYATLKINYGLDKDMKEIILDCKAEALLKIRGKLDQIHEKLGAIFAEEE